MIENIIKDGIKIINIEGGWLQLNNDDNGLFFEFDTTKDKTFINKDGEAITIKSDLEKLFTATMPYSLETIRAFNAVDGELLNKKMKKYKADKDKLVYTKLFVNFKFKKKLFDDNISDDEDEIDEDNDEFDLPKNIDKKKLRELVYTSKVIIDGEEYCFFKRGASKARTANVIFCKKKYYKKLFDRCLLGLEIEKNSLCDLTSIGAYTSLIMSGVIGTIDIPKEEILIINDIDSPVFKAKQTLTVQNKDNTITQIDNLFDVSNCTTDGQSLMDESKFEENELIRYNSTALLRSDFLKSNSCRTAMQRYFEENNITKVWDKYRGWMDASKIRLIITPNSCKFLKFASYFKDEKACFEHWLNNIDSTFGVVKTDHMGNYGYSNRLSYQMINSMNLSKDEVRELMQDELDYVKLLKDNTLVTSDDFSSMGNEKRKANREIRNEMSYFLNYLGTSDDLSSGDMINALLNRNKDYRFTQKFKDYKKNQIKLYIDNLRLGKIRIKNSLYAIMVSCPYEMLVSATIEENKINDSIMKGWELYCPRFEDNKSLMGIRNPQINEGNIGHFTNTFHEEYKWFGYWKDGKPQFDFVAFVNSWDIDIMNRLQGCDWDVDTVFLTDNELLARKSLECQKWATPTNGIKGKMELKTYNMKSYAELDNYLGGSTMAIGKIVNKSAIFNAYMYDGMNKGKSQEYINACFEASSTLSSCSQIAIDMAKKSFLDAKGRPLSLNSIMNGLNKTSYINEENKEELILQYDYDMENTEDKSLKEVIEDYQKYKADEQYIRKFKTNINLDQYLDKYSLDNNSDEFKAKIPVHSLKMVVPYFFKFTAQDNSYRIPKKMECGMDYLEEILDEFDTKAMKVDKVELKDLFEKQERLQKVNIDFEKINIVRHTVHDCNSILNKNYYSNIDDEKEGKRKSILRKGAKNKAIEQLKKIKLNERTIHRILLRTFELDKTYKGEIIYVLNKEGKKIKYKNSKTGKDEYLVVKELYDIQSLTLTLLYNAYPQSFLKCFKENKLEKINLPLYWK